MKITCQSCGQILPKTILVCPNCGGRQFSESNASSQATPHSTQYHVPLNEQLVKQPNTAAHSPYTEPYTQPTAVPVTPYAEASPAFANPAIAPATSTSPIIGNTQPVQPSLNYPTTTAPVLPPVRFVPKKPAHTMRYAGFIRRVFAEVFDGALVGILVALVWNYVQTNYKLPIANSQMLYAEAITITAIYILYSAFFTSRSRQATIGKMLVGLWVFDMQGMRIGFIHAVFREVLKVILLPFAVLMWFTSRRQALHDFIARTVVLVD